MHYARPTLYVLKRLVVFLLICFSALQTIAQLPGTESLWHIVEITQNDSLCLQAITRLHNRYIGREVDSNFYYSARLLQVCEKLNTPRYTALANAKKKIKELEKS